MIPPSACQPWQPDNTAAHPCQGAAASTPRPGTRSYERHKEAFEFIFKCRPEPLSLLTVVQQHVQGVLGLIEDSSGGNLFRFLPEVWDKRLTAIKGDPTKWSKTGRGILFEGKTFPYAPGRVNIALILGPGDPAMRSAVYQAAAIQPKLFTGLVKPMGAQWATIFSRDLLTFPQAKGLTFEAQASSVGLSWSDFQGKTLQLLIDTVLAIDEKLAAAGKAPEPTAIGPGPTIAA